MKYNIFLTAGVIGALSLVATAVYANSFSAEDFVTKAAVANQFEIESSKIALEKSHSGDIKAFAQRMVDDHTKTGKKLTHVLEANNEQITPPDELDHKHQKVLDKLKSATGDDFDGQYVDAQTDAHKEAVKLFANYSQYGKDEPLKNFAAKTLPMLRDHLKHVKELKADQ